MFGNLQRAFDGISPGREIDDAAAVLLRLFQGGQDAIGAIDRLVVFDERIAHLGGGVGAVCFQDAKRLATRERR